MNQASRLYWANPPFGRLESMVKVVARRAAFKVFLALAACNGNPIVSGQDAGPDLGRVSLCGTADCTPKGYSFGAKWSDPAILSKKIDLKDRKTPGPNTADAGTADSHTSLKDGSPENRDAGSDLSEAN